MIKTLGLRLAAWRRERETIRELSQLTSRELSDLGIGRADIAFVAAGGFLEADEAVAAFDTAGPSRRAWTGRGTDRPGRLTPPPGRHLRRITDATDHARHCVWVGMPSTARAPALRPHRANKTGEIP